MKARAQDVECAVLSWAHLSTYLEEPGLPLLTVAKLLLCGILFVQDNNGAFEYKCLSNEVTVYIVK